MYNGILKEGWNHYGNGYFLKGFQTHNHWGASESCGELVSVQILPTL
jgi:hypothetical protein